MITYTLVFLRKRGDQPYMLADFQVTKDFDVKCWWTTDFNKRYLIDDSYSNPIQRTEMTLRGLRQHLINTGRFTSDQLSILHG